MSKKIKRWEKIQQQRQQKTSGIPFTFNVSLKHLIWINDDNVLWRTTQLNGKNNADDTEHVYKYVMINKPVNHFPDIMSYVNTISLLCSDKTYSSFCFCISFVSL